MSETRRNTAGIHTCHAECPCQTGGEHAPDFLPKTRNLLEAVMVWEAEQELAAADARYVVGRAEPVRVDYHEVLMQQFERIEVQREMALKLHSFVWDIGGAREENKK